MLRTVKRVLVIAAITTTGVAASVATAHASTAGPRLVTAVGAVAATQPTVNLSGKGKALTWTPKSVKAKPVSGTCAAGNYSFLIVNNTKANQQVEYSGGPLGSVIPPKDGLYVCGSGKIKTNFWPKADPKALLKVTIT
jgi:hypothetical protein